MSKTSTEQQITHYFLKSFENNTLPWRKTWADGILSIASPKRDNNEFYQGVNTLILMVSALNKNYSSPYWMTYNQCRNAGGNIMKGQKSTRILKFGTIDKSEPADDDQRLIPFIRIYSVFNIEQAENLPDEYVQERTVAEVPTHNINDLVDALGVKLITGHRKAFYVPELDVIRIPNQSDFVSADAFAAVVAHELIHWTARKDRLDRILNSDKESAEYSFEELVAEIGSVMLCSRLGIPTRNDETHVPYISMWISNLNSDPKFIIKAASKAQKAVEYILSNGISAQKVA